MTTRKIWTTQEDKIIKLLVQEHGSKNWALIANQLSKKSGLKGRSGKQCRQRWHNHLNPVIQKKGWTAKEESKLFQLHAIHGNKWTAIAQALPGRTDNAIKNYFYSTIRRSLRRMGKYMGGKNSTQKIKQIKPSTLSHIFGGNFNQKTENIEEQKLMDFIKQNCEQVKKQIVRFTSYKPKRNQKPTEQQKRNFESVINTMSYINDNYQKIKNQQRKRRQEQLYYIKQKRPYLSSDSSQEISEEQSQNQNQNEESVHQRIPPKIQQKQQQTTHQDQTIILAPTFIVKSQQNLSPLKQEQPHLEKHISQEDVDPSFFIQLQDDNIPLISVTQNPLKMTLNMKSPGLSYSLSSNPFTFNLSPLTPKHFQHHFLIDYNNNQIQDYTSLIQKQIQSNRREGFSSFLTPSMGSPGSAFRFFNRQN